MRKTAYRGLLVGAVASVAALGWLFQSSSRIVYDGDSSRSLDSGPSRVALDPIPLAVLAARLGFSDPAQAVFEGRILAERVSAGFLPNDWAQRCRSNYSAQLCGIVDDYFLHPILGPSTEPKHRHLRGERFDMKHIEALQREDLANLHRRAPQWGLRQVEGFAAGALKSQSCPRNFSIVLSYRAEAHLPSSEAMELMEKLQAHAGACIEKDDPVAEPFNLSRGLLMISQDRFEEALPFLRAALESTQRHEEYRSLFWLIQVTEALNLNEEAEAHRDILYNKFPLSWHSIVDSASHGRDPLQPILARPVEGDRQDTGDEVSDKKLAWLAFVLAVDEAPYAQRRFAEYVIRSLGPNVSTGLLQHLARNLDRAGLHRLQILALTQVVSGRPEAVSRETLRLLFPKPYFELLDQQSPHLDTAILLGLARQESGFDPQATSKANAQGLLQILPSTARGVKKGAGKQLYDYARNIEVGAKFLMRLIHQFDGSVERALASYNAGQGNVKKWMSRYSFVDDPMLFVDMIPFRETRDYVPSILRNAYWYHRLFPDLTAEIKNDKEGKLTTSVLLRPLLLDSGVAKEP